MKKLIDERREARLNAEDDAVKYLCKNFRPEVGAAIATTVENEFAERWLEEREQLIRRNDQGKYFQISTQEMRDARRHFSELPPGNSDPEGEQHLYEIVSRFRHDERWFIVHKVAQYLRRISEREKLTRGAPPLDNGISSMDFSGLITTTPKIP